jgi:hypothetical protein
MIQRFFKVPVAGASGLPGTPSVFSLEQFYSRPFSSVSGASNIAARVPLGWTQNPLAPAGFSGGLVGNGFDGTNV